jgi:Family of unknown function (DUF6521)
MNSLTREVRIVQNAALGGTLIWRFAVGYSQASPTHSPAPLPLGFLVLPIAFHQDTLELVSSTRTDTGLHAFVDKFSRTETQKADLLLSIHSRVVAMRLLSWRSVCLSIERQLVSLDTEQAAIIALSRAIPAGVPASVRPLLAGTEKLGAWCSRLSLLEICSVLKVQL